MTLETRSKSFGMCINVEGFLRNTKYPSGFRDLVEGDDGKMLPAPQARDWFKLQQHQGRKVIPCNGECGSPCKNAEKGCTGFDYSGGGCPGHYTTEQKQCLSCGGEHEFYSDGTPVGGALPCGH